MKKTDGGKKMISRTSAKPREAVKGQLMMKKTIKDKPVYKLEAKITKK